MSAMPITLNRAQREALRGEIRVAAGDGHDINLALEDYRDRPAASDMGRDFVVKRIALLQQLVAVLDTIGWTEPEDTPDDLEIVADRPLMLWARGQFQELARSLGESTPYDMDEALAALGALHLIAEDLIADEGGE